MQSDTIISLILAVPIGIITGLYSGFIISRYIRFSDLRNQLIRIIRSIEYIQEENYVAIQNDQDVAKIPLIASDLFFLKHKNAGEIVTKLRSSIDQMKILAASGQIDVLAYDDSYKQWQTIVNNLTPNRAVLLSFWSRL